MIEIKHHSLADWDYGTPGPYISDETFVSPPSSLAAKRLGPLDRQGWATCKLSSALCIPDGRLVSYIRLGTTIWWAIAWYYRAQANPVPAGALPADCYHLCFSVGNAYIYRRLAGVTTTIVAYAFLPKLSIDTWYKFRLTWWQNLRPDMTILVRHQIERWVSEAWVLIAQGDESFNNWKDSATNKVGFVVLHDGKASPTAIDNSEIWKRIT